MNFKIQGTSFLYPDMAVRISRKSPLERRVPLTHLLVLGRDCFLPPSYNSIEYYSIAEFVAPLDIFKSNFFHTNLNIGPFFVFT